MNYFLKIFLKLRLFFKGLFKELTHTPKNYLWSVEIPSSSSSEPLDCEFVRGDSVLKIGWVTHTFIEAFAPKVTADQNIKKLYIARSTMKRPIVSRIETITCSPGTLCTCLKTFMGRNQWFMMFVEEKGLVWEVSFLWTKDGWFLDADPVSDSPWMVDFSVVSPNLNI